MKGNSWNDAELPGLSFSAYFTFSFSWFNITDDLSKRFIQTPRSGFIIEMNQYLKSLLFCTSTQTRILLMKEQKFGLFSRFGESRKQNIMSLKSKKRLKMFYFKSMLIIDDPFPCFSFYIFKPARESSPVFCRCLPQHFSDSYWSSHLPTESHLSSSRFFFYDDIWQICLVFCLSDVKSGNLFWISCSGRVFGFIFP